MRYLRSFDSLKPGDHACLIYDDVARRDALFREFVEHGIRRGERVILVKPDAADESVIPSRAAWGQFGAFSSNETYISAGRFDASSALQMLRTERDRSVAGGFSALRAAGEPPVEVRANGYSHALVDWERSANDLFASGRMVAVCAYHVATTAPDAIIGLMNAHPVVFFAQQPNYRVRVDQIDTRRLAISGWLDVTTMGSVVGTLKQAVDAGGDLELDLADIDFVDLAGIRLFAEAADRLGSAGSTLFLCSAPAWMVQILELLECFGTGLAVR